MFQNFAFQMEPKTPDNLEDLVESVDNIPIITIGVSMYSSLSKVEYRSILLKGVIPDLVADEAQNSRNLQTYNRLGENVFAMNFEVSPFVVAKNISTSGFLWNYNDTKDVGGTTGIFAVVDYPIFFKLLRHSLALFGKYSPARPHNSMSFYTTRGFWFVRKNFFSNMFTNGLASFVESGIYERFGKNAFLAKLQTEIYASFKEWKKEHPINGIKCWGS